MQEVPSLTQAADKLASTLKGSADEPVKIEAVLEQGRQLLDATGAAAKAARIKAQSFVDSAPPLATVAATVANAELPMKFVQAPMLLGLFVPPPQWPPRTHTVASFLRAATLPTSILVGVSALVVGLLVGLLVLLPLLLPLLILGSPLIVPLGVFVGHRRAERRQLAAAAVDAAERAAADATLDTNPSAYLSTSTAVSRKRRTRVAQQILRDVAARSVGKHATPFNEHVANATGLAVYGCGVLAATHVGALRALERHGLNYGRVQTYAGVSAGAVVSAMLAVGCCADEVHDLIVKLDFQRLVRPELGSLLRCGANLLLSSLLQISAASSDTLLERGHGPGVNSGRVLEDMVGEALRAKTGDAGITLGQVLTKFGKRLVLIATELDSGKERRLTPENDAHLPVRVAVRMSMGIPGAFEPFKYQGHLYCDGGMINDFPITALPDKAHRLGLCVKQKSYVSYNMGSYEEVVGREQMEAYPAVRDELTSAQSKLWEEGAYPTRELVDFATTCVNIMMDANLDLQIDAARKAARRAKGGKAASRREQLLSSIGIREAPAEESPVSEDVFGRGDVFELAPQILTLCSGALQPFDFGLSAKQHTELFLAGQLFTHLYATQLGGEGTPPTLTDEQKLHALLWILQLDYPTKETGW